MKAGFLAKFSIAAAILAGVATGFAGRVAAQCAPQWDAASLPGTDGEVYAVAEWDPDGAGPLPAHLVFGGSFTAIADQATPGIAMRDNVTGQWHPLGAGLSGGFVQALVVTANNELVAAGNFTFAGTTAIAGIARWTGSSWAPLGSGLAGLAAGDWIQCATALPNGDVVVGGRFTSIGGIAAANIARWDGVTWHALGAGLTGSQAYARHLTTTATGDVLVAGSFTSAGGVAANAVARWSGSAWSSLGWTQGSFAGGGLQVDAAGNVVVGFGGLAGIQRWNGVTWTQVAPSPNLLPLDMAFDASGNLVLVGIVGGSSGANVGSVGVWNGIAWSQLGVSPVGAVDTVDATSLGLVFGGQFSDGSGGGPQDMALWDAAAGTWRGLTPVGFDNEVTASVELANGDLIVGGWFTTPGQHIARRVGGAWQPLGSGVDGPVYALAALPGGGVAVGGNFQVAGGVPCDGIALWQNGAWSALPGAPGVAVHAIAITANGDLYIGGVFNGRVARWDGAAWTLLSGLTWPVWALAAMPDGSVVAGGDFPGQVARWNGSAWNTLGGGTDGSVRALRVRRDGSLLVGGFFAHAGGLAADRVALWTGSAWTSLGTTGLQYVSDIDLLPTGETLLSGRSSLLQGALLRDTGTWQSLAGALTSSGIFSIAYTVTVCRSGEVVVGGYFESAGGQPSAHLARWVGPCPAVVVAVGSGCTGAGGANVLTAATTPWVGAPFVSEVAGLAANGLGVGVLGFAAPAVPLSVVTPLGLPGCDLETTADVLSLLVPVAGRAVITLAIPNTPAVVGLTFREQVVAIELSATAITAFTSSNALAALIGSY